MVWRRYGVHEDLMTRSLMVRQNVVNGKPVTAHIYEYTTQSMFRSVHSARS